EIKRHGDFCIGAACYPEGHVECESMERDLDHLRTKVDCGVDFLTTQMFFDNTAFYSFMFRAMKKGIDVPIIAGIMPMTNSAQIVRSCKLSGATLPTRFRRIADKFGENPEAMKQAGIAYATEQIIDLIANGVKGIHLYTMNKPDVAEKIMSNLSCIVGADRICMK
ncbi:MAG: methylenetetrahydrofolate reductase, partial [Clostridia bacterium]|nr:methylenetetrahydrofolate reductase [Clostridia bacterium]